VKTFAALLLAIAVLGATAATPARAADPYVVNVVLSLTGGAAFLGSKEAASLRVLEATVNAAGGVRGRPVKFDIADDSSNPQTAVQLVNALVAKNVPFIYGPTLTAVCQAVAPIVDKAGPATFCLSPTIFPRPGGYMFMGAPSIDDVQPVLFRYLVARKLTKIALITSTDASGADFEKRVDGTLAQPEFKNVQIVTREHFAPSDISVAAQMARIKAASPDVLLTFTVGTPFGTLLKGVHDAGLDIPVYGSGGNFTYAQMQQYASFLPKELILNGSRGITPDPTATGATKKAQDAYFAALAKAGLRSEFATSIPWDPMSIMLEVVRRAGTDADAAKIYDTLENLKGWTGIEGTYDFTTKDQRGLGQSAAALFRYDQAANAFVQVFPTKR
jgi:branched-chain amino acid transport system substrate-binding protein